MIKGTKREESKVVSGLDKYIGFTCVEVRAINPTRRELNKMLGKEDGDDDKEIVYLSADQEGNDKLRLTFWLYDAKLDKFFPYSFNLTNKHRLSKDGLKYQYVNNVCTTGWADEPENLFKWFTKFTSKTGEELGDKEFRKAISGEEELVNLLRSWLGRMKWSDAETSVLIDMDILFKEDYSELRSLIDSDYDTPFVILLGVETDENDTEKQYQKVYGKSFLPASFINFINKDLKFPTDYSKKVWNRFEADVTGEYGFQAYFELVPLQEYNKEKDVAASPTTIGVTLTNSKF